MTSKIDAFHPASLRCDRGLSLACRMRTRKIMNPPPLAHFFHFSLEIISNACHAPLLPLWNDSNCRLHHWHYISYQDVRGGACYDLEAKVIRKYLQAEEHWDSGRETLARMPDKSKYIRLTVNHESYNLLS